MVQAMISNENFHAAFARRSRTVALDERAAADFLWQECGVVFRPATLRKRRCVGGGPPFFKAGRRVFYEPEPLRAWGFAQRSPNVTSTSELGELLGPAPTSTEPA